MESNQVKDMMCLMAERICTIANKLSNSQTDCFIDEILRAKRIYVIGAGRSGLVAKGFAMRLMHLGLISYVAGETITPALKPGDLVVIFSGSGRTKTVADIAEMAKEIGARLSLITSNADSRIGNMADCVVEIENQRDFIREDNMEYEIRQMMGKHHSFAPLGTLFETASMIFADACISRLMVVTKTDEVELKKRHNVLE